MSDLSILIVNWNTQPLLAGCLASIFNNLSLQARDQSPSIEVLVVDNASSDGSAAMVRDRFPQVHLIQNKVNVGFARANNQALAHSQGRYLLLLNSDTVVHPGALKAMVAFMEGRRQVGACGARLLNSDGSLQPSVHPMLTPGRELWRLIFFDRILPRATYPQARWDTVTPRRVETIKGACLLVRRAAVDQGGLLDDRYFMYTEEVDLCRRLALADWELWYVPSAVVTHLGEASSRQVAEAMFLQLYRSKIQFYRKFGGERQAARFKTYLRLAYVPRWATARLAAFVARDWRKRAHIYRRLLAELPTM